jgi:ABC-type molybdate transport system substrate-binding protein
MGACGKLAAACILGILLGVLGSLPQGAAVAAELTVLTNQGATPGVRELAAAFSRASGHKVTVIQPAGAALEQRINNGPADLITSNPEPIEELVKKGKIVAGTVTPLVLAGPGLSVRAATSISHGRGLRRRCCGEVDRLFARLQRHKYRRGIASSASPSS